MYIYIYIYKQGRRRLARPLPKWTITLAPTFTSAPD